MCESLRRAAAMQARPGTGWKGEADEPHLRNFRRIKRSIDIGPLVRETRTAETLWSLNTRRQLELPVHRETNSIILRAPDVGWFSTQNVRDVQKCRTMPEASVFPLLMRFLGDFSREQHASLQRAMIVRLRPGGAVYPHVDTGRYYQITDRYHLVLVSPRGSPMVCGTEKVVMHEGELWWFQNKLRHDAYNHAASWRVHVIFDLLPAPLTGMRE
jgi:hypothetical protein